MAFRLIVAIPCLQVLINFLQPAMSVTTADEWRNCYDEIFAQTGRNLTDLSIMKHMTFMHETSQKVATDSSISEDMRDNVQFWHDALTDTNKAHCNAGYIDGLRDRFEHIRDQPTPNLVALFVLVHSNLIEFCSDSHSELKNALNSKFDHPDKTGMGMMQNSYIRYIRGQISKKELGKELFEKLDVLTTCNNDKIYKAWQNGPCGKLNTYMKQIDAPAFYEFVNLVNYELFATEPAKNSAVHWAKVVYACDRMGSMLSDLARDNNLRRVCGRKIKTGLDSLGFSKSRDVL